LQTLSPEDTHRQLECLAQLGSQFQHAQDFAIQIHALTDGVPEGNALIAAKIGQPPKMPGEAETFIDYNTRLLDKDVPKGIALVFLCP